MTGALIRFYIGFYTGRTVRALDETAYLNKLLNEIICDSLFVFDEEELTKKAIGMASQLEKGLKEANKPIAAFCYLNGISENNLAGYCASEYRRGCMEDMLIKTVAQNESIEVTESDLASYRCDYPTNYSRALMDGMGSDEEPLKKAILAKKTLQFLGHANTWERV